MWASTSESHVRVGIPGEVKCERVGESALVVIGRDVPRDDLVAGGNGYPRQLRVTNSGPSEMDLGASPSKNLFCCCVDQVGLFSQPV